MGKFKRAILLSFRTKVIVPVMAVMVLLMAISMGLVNRRVTLLLRQEATKQLVAFDAVFKNLQEEREIQLLLRFRNVVKESRFKSLAMLDTGRPGLSEDSRQTIRGVLFELTEEGAADAIVFSSGAGQHVTVTRDPHLNTLEIETGCSNAVELALQGRPAVLTVQNGSRLFDTVSIPVRVGNRIAGVVTFAVVNSLAQEFNQQTQSELVLLTSGKIVQSTLRHSALLPEITPLFTPATAPASHNVNHSVRDIMLDGEHFLGLGGEWTTSDESSPFQYAILSSYERPLLVLAETQNLILLISSFAIVLGVAVVWFVVSRVTRPLEVLRAEVEAVGGGDFTRRIEVKSMDECGELAEVFNQMTGNLNISRQQLETSVETLKATQAQLIQSEKLSGIGEFVAGVAHELNNPLTTVMGFSELLQKAGTNPQHKRQLEMIHKSAVRCQKIVQNLLSFSRRHKPERKLVSLNALVDAAVDILAYQLRTSNIEVVVQLEPQLPEVMVDSHQIQQVLINILNNARQAMEAHQPKGCVRISTRHDGATVKIIFRDNGPGIRKEHVAKLFDPFFTTKEVGKGTGLGLSICYGIIKEHGGTITVQSEYGEGATFIIELPAASDTDLHTHNPTTPAAAPANHRTGIGKAVLVIDDEEPILQMTSEILTRSGYQVDVATDGESALRRLGSRKYDLAICDWKMPGLNGQQFYERLCVVDPALAGRLIFMTGDVINQSTNTFLAEHKKPSISKPFSLDEFEAAVSNAIPPG